MKRVAIIGGGIAGLSAAFYLERARRDPLEWTLFEKSDRLGGVMKTERHDGYVLEAGPDSFLTAKPDGAELCRELGIGDQLISSNDSERKTYILVQGRLIPIPDGLEFMVPTRIWPMVTTQLFSWGTRLRMAAELLSSRPAERHIEGQDEPVASFVRRHFGQQMVERVAEPLLAGVYGGDAEQLSVRAVLPRFVEMERQHGSLVRASLRARRANLSAVRNPQTENRGNLRPQALFTSLNNGMQQMVDAIVSRLPASSLRVGERVLNLRRAKEGWLVESSKGTESFDAVLLALPAPAAAELVRPLEPQLSDLLEKIQYTSSVAVAVAYDRVDLPPGHGLLVPRAEMRKMMACTFVHKKFPHRAPPGSALLRCFMSSSRVPELLSYSDDALVEIIREELEEILGISARPRLARVFRWERALPQYETGHLERIAIVERMMAKMPGTHIIGNSFYGIGIPDCIRSARLAVERITSSVFEPASVECPREILNGR